MEVTKYRQSVREGSRKPVIVDGARTAFVKSFGQFEDCTSLELFSRSVDGLLRKLSFDPAELDEISCGAVVPQIKNGNVARDTIFNLGLPNHVHGYTVNRACTSSLQTVSEACTQILAGRSVMVLAGGVDCMSDVPITYSDKARKFLVKLSKTKTMGQKLSMLGQFSAKAFLPQSPNLTEPMTGLTMGQHAEIMAKKNGISREDQDRFAMESHAKAIAAQERGVFAEEIVPVWPGPKYGVCADKDNAIRNDCTMEAMAKLRPAFDKKYGTITAASSSGLTDGAAVALIADEERAKSLGLKPKARIKDILYVGLDPFDQLLIGPAVAIPMLCRRNKLAIGDIDRFEIHEAFAAQVLSCLRSMDSKEFNDQYFGTAPFGLIPADKLNVNGGAIALGHPLGASGARLLVSMANELVRSNKERGVISVCAAGGMAVAALVERI
jgi:acetyl-CoA acetyltransferase family protein